MSLPVPDPSPPRGPRAWAAAGAEPLRQLLLDHVRSLTGQASRLADFTQPAGDPGWYGPGSVSWEVHADFVAMLTGGVRALLLQCLHPLAMAGVWDHSNFRDDLQGRLQRTALFVASTTYGPQALADAAVARVRGIHARVQGQAPDGRPYRADDPALLTWVHVAEVSSFLAAYETLHRMRLPPARRDAYFTEQARVARALGASEVPGSAREVEAYLQAMRPQLLRDARTDEVVRVLRRLTGLGRLGAANALVVEAGFDLLPDWARQLLGEPPPAPLARRLRLHSLQAAVPLMRWVLEDGVAAQARRRCASGPEGRGPRS